VPCRVCSFYPYAIALLKYVGCFLAFAFTCRFAKGVLSGVVPWREARRFFAWRLKRRLTEEGLIRHISSTDVSINRLDAVAMVSSCQQHTALTIVAARCHRMSAACGCLVFVCSPEVACSSIWRT
jgi:hypothetical protein